MAPPIVRDVAELISRAKGKALVVVDGVMAIGKTTLSRSLATGLQACHVQTDWFFQNLWGRDATSLTYAEVLDLESLEVRLENALACGPVILDGICVRDVVHRLERAPDFHVLMTSMDPLTARFRPGQDDPMLGGEYGHHVNEAALLDDNVSEEALMTELRKDWGPLDLFTERSLVAYFKRLQPHKGLVTLFMRA